ncbi:MAG: type II toxin-antitoxin system PemK/MazF family toxin [Spirochaetales bacterium]|nr:type II toxin-antitoxin system PemK/MazF family toxin [Spirochaetales bacterium]MCF7938974.1 type II toxin-antitoxin system PemK/MazF family toxin [Spirochaetales bacterium]
MIERYGVYWVHLDPVIGREMAKTRPAVVVSDNDMNRLLDTLVVCPITSRLHERWPSRIQITIEGRGGEIAVDQILTISKKRIGKKIHTLNAPNIEKLRHIITVMYGVLSE